MPCDDAGALATGIELVSDDPGLAAQMVQAGRARVERDFCEPVIIGQYRDLYRQLAGG